ncbi:peptidoglycan binding domain-containing protein [Kitasatospora cineracea]|uniref:peptidoglycan binding domain-containing protein n=1 Tax=Kitasatospora cineracea TaxID=88074 RepID=UPI0033E956AF
MSSRESDNAQPQPRRGGPDAYPSGTPPYGTGVPGGLGADPAAGRTAPGPRADEADAPKTTETTLTTRVRINIPGSRPIPPVVVQSKVKDEQPAEPSGPRHRGGAGDPVLGVMDSGGRTGTPPTLPPEWQEPAAPKAAAKASESDSTGEWFKPRQKGRPEPAPAAAPAGPAQPAAGAPQAAQQPAPRPSGAPASPFAPADPAVSSRTGGHPLPQQGDPFQAAAAQDPFAQDPFAQQPGRPGQAQQQPMAAPGPQDPFAQDPFAQQQGRQPGPQGRQPQQQSGLRANRAAAAADDPFAAPRPGQGQADPFAAGPGPRGAERPGATGAAGEPEDTQIGGFDPVTGEEPAPGAAISDPPTTQLFLKSPNGGDPFAEEPGSRSPAQAQSRPSGDGGGRFADLPAAQPFPGGSRAATPKREPSPEAAAAAAAAREAAEEEEPAARKKGGRGRKLVVTGLGGVLFLGAAVYGAGLMMNQSDIPKGTTVLGTDIGGDSRDQAVTALDGSVGKAGQQPIRVKIGDQSATLDPASAGLSFDTTATVDALTKHSYNPVEVLGSLTGNAKAVEPQVRVDRAKLKAALDDLGAKSGQSLQEGYVRFTKSGGTEVVPGAGGKALDSAAAADLVEQAYRGRAAGQADTEVALPVADAQPKVGQDVLQAAADGLGKQVLNGNVTVTAGTKQFAFGRNTAADALVLAPDASGTVVLKWDLDKLAAAVGTTFDKVKTTHNGQQVQITAQDVADAIGQGVPKTGKDRTVKIPA